MVGIDDVAREAGVSIATVSRAMRDLPNVAPGTRQRVVETAARLGYRPNPNASRLASGRAGTLGVVVTNIDSWFFGEVAQATNAVFQEAGRDLSLLVVAPGEQVRDLVARNDLSVRYGGLLLVNLPLTDEVRDVLGRTGIPCVAVGSASGITPAVRVDEHAVGRLAVRHLVGLGHRRIGIVGDARAESIFRGLSERRAGAEQELDATGLDFGDHLHASGAFSVAGGVEAGHELLAAADRPTAIFALSDEMAIGVFGAARQRGLRVPEDLSIIGVDDHDTAVAIGLTTIEQQVRDQGVRAARLLLGLLDGTSVSADRDVVLPVELVVRGTTAPFRPDPRAAG